MEKLHKSAKTRPGADCGSDHQLLIAKFRLKLKQAGKATRPVRCDLNQIPSEHIAEETEIQGIRSSKQSAWRTMDRGSEYCTGGSKQSHPKKKECKKAEWLSEEALQTAEQRREAKSKGEKERYTHLNAELQRIARKDKKAFLND